LKSNYDYKVAWCYVCDQGWVEIKKTIESDMLILQCSECFSQWENPLAYKKKEFIEYEISVTEPEFEEIINVGWDKHIVES